MGRAWQALGQKLAWNSRLKHPRGMARANHANPTRGGHHPWEAQESQKSNFRQTHCEASSPLPVHHNDPTSSPDECQEHTATLERFCEILFWGPLGRPRVMPYRGWGTLAWLARAMASGVPQTTIPCQLLPQSLPSTTHLAMLEQ